MQLTTIENPVAAATHRDPYSYYSELVAEKPLYWDDDLTAWVASGAPYLEELFNKSSAHVRPARERVPHALVGTGAGAVFGMLARMNDGARHRSLRKTVELILEGLSEFKLGTTEVADSASGLDDFIERVPVFAMARMLGFDTCDPAALVPLVRAISKSFAPNPTADVIADGTAATHELIDRCKMRWPDEDLSVIANVLGLFFQSYDATRGLIGNTLISLRDHAHAFVRVREGREALSSVVEETARYDSPVQNTRRFLVDDLRIANAELRGGETVLLLIGAANRDSRLNQHPHRFDTTRENRRMYTFGAGPHACPGKTIAVAIVAAAVEHLLETGFDVCGIASHVTYRRSTNLRIPLFDSVE